MKGRVKAQAALPVTILRAIFGGSTPEAIRTIHNGYFFAEERKAVKFVTYLANGFMFFLYQISSVGFKNDGIAINGPDLV